MAIAFVNGATATSGASAVLTKTVTYSPTAGNFVIAVIMANGALTSLRCADNNNNALDVVTNQGNCWVFFIQAFAGTTSFTFTWTTTSRKATVAVAEYSGATAIKGVKGSTNSGSSTAPTLSVTTTSINSFIVVGMGSGTAATWTASVGNLRESLTGGSGNANTVAIFDNTTANSGTSVTNTGTLSTTGAWNTVGTEIFLVLPTPSLAQGVSQPDRAFLDYEAVAY